MTQDRFHAWCELVCVAPRLCGYLTELSQFAPPNRSCRTVRSNTGFGSLTSPSQPFRQSLRMRRYTEFSACSAGLASTATNLPTPSPGARPIRPRRGGARGRRLHSRQNLHPCRLRLAIGRDEGEDQGDQGQDLLGLRHGYDLPTLQTRGLSQVARSSPDRTSPALNLIAEHRPACILAGRERERRDGTRTSAEREWAVMVAGEPSCRAAPDEPQLSEASCSRILPCLVFRTSLAGGHFRPR